MSKHQKGFEVVPPDVLHQGPLSQEKKSFNAREGNWTLDLKAFVVTIQRRCEWLVEKNILTEIVVFIVYVSKNERPNNSKVQPLIPVNIRSDYSSDEECMRIAHSTSTYI